MRGKKRSKVVKGPKKKLDAAKKKPDMLDVSLPIPRGMQILMVYSGIMAVLYLLSIFLYGSSVQFGLDGTAAAFANFVLFLATMVIVYGIAYRKEWCYWFASAVYISCIIGTAISLLFLKKASWPVGAMLLVSALTLAMNLLTLWYVHIRKDFFMGKAYSEGHKDKVFRTAIYSFYAFAGLLVLILGATVFITAERGLGSAMKATAGMSIGDAQAYCEDLPTKDQDSCFLGVAANNKDSADIYKLCSSIERSYYRLACLRVTG